MAADIKTRLKSIRKRRTIAVKAEKEIVKEIYALSKEVESYIRSQWTSEFPNTHAYILSGLDCGCTSIHPWRVEAWLYSINGRAFTEIGWVLEADLGREYPPLPIPCPVSEKKLQEFLKRISDETAVHLSLAKTDLPTEPDDEEEEEED